MDFAAADLVALPKAYDPMPVFRDGWNKVMGAPPEALLSQVLGPYRSQKHDNLRQLLSPELAVMLAHTDQPEITIEDARLMASLRCPWATREWVSAQGIIHEIHNSRVLHEAINRRRMAVRELKNSVFGEVRDAVLALAMCFGPEHNPLVEVETFLRQNAGFSALKQLDFAQRSDPSCPGR